MAAWLWFCATYGQAQMSPYGNPYGPHQVVYPCATWNPGVPHGQSPTGCPGLHGGPCIPDVRGFGCGDAFPTPAVFSTDPFTVMLGFRGFFMHSGEGRYGVFNGFLPNYVFNAFEARRAEIDTGCTNVVTSGRAGCTYPHAWWQWDSVEPPAQAIFLQIQAVLAADPGFQVKCAETQDQWIAEFYGTPYAGGSTCPLSAPVSPVLTATPTATLTATAVPATSTATPIVAALPVAPSSPTQTVTPSLEPTAVFTVTAPGPGPSPAPPAVSTSTPVPLPTIVRPRKTPTTAPPSTTTAVPAIPTPTTPGSPPPSSGGLWLAVTAAIGAIAAWVIAAWKKIVAAFVRFKTWLGGFFVKKP